MVAVPDDEMHFPLELNVNLAVGVTNPFGLGADDLPGATHPIKINEGLTVLIGPNGSGKTHILRSLQRSGLRLPGGKITRFISAGRIGMMEQWRAILVPYNDVPDYDNLRVGDFSQRGNRYRNETLDGDYQTLAERPDIQLKVRERLKKLFKRDISLQWDNGNLRIFFSTEETGSKEYSAAKEASGLLHLAGLLAAIYDDHIGMLLLDEPEVSLHPQLQAFLLKEILSVAGLPGERNKKLVIISTHSTEFLRVDAPSDLSNLIFTTSVTAPPVQIETGTPELKNRKIAELISRMGQEHKLSFFTKSPLLVEGPSDAIICAGLASKLGFHLEAGGSQVLPVVGKGQFPVVLKLLRMMGKTPIVLADADAFTDGNELVLAFAKSAEADDVAISMSHDGIYKMYSVVQSAFAQTVQSSWEEIRELAEATLDWKRKTSDDEGKLRRRAAFSAMFANDPELLSQQWRVMRKRLSSVLDALEAGGCHILRKGSIEAYYKTPVHSSEVKPSAATEEVIAFKQDDDAAVESRYSDIIRCLKRASRTDDVNESEILRDAIISIAAPLVAQMRVTSGINIDRIVKASRHPLAEIFKFSETDGDLVIELESSILDVDCFPIRISPSEDIVTKVSELVRR